MTMMVQALWAQGLAQGQEYEHVCEDVYGPGMPVSVSAGYGHGHGHGREREYEGAIMHALAGVDASVSAGTR
jgi:hypothetical protein